VYRKRAFHLVLEYAIPIRVLAQDQASTSRFVSSSLFHYHKPAQRSDSYIIFIQTVHTRSYHLHCSSDLVPGTLRDYTPGTRRNRPKLRSYKEIDYLIYEKFPLISHITTGSQSRPHPSWSLMLESSETVQRSQLWELQTDKTRTSVY
jgi:hypothetical protein